jgi:hypothetical protein
LDHLAINDRSPPEAKIALFRKLFRGREDVFARRFESRTSGRSGYAPACGNEWLRGVCQKPRGKCSACQNQQYLPITDAVIRWHLLGRDDRGADFVVGVYPMLLDETCFFLAMDFDKRSWQEDVQAVLATCGRIGVPAALERSRSGAGGHVWIFFPEPVAASLARRLGAHILTETMEARPELGLDASQCGRIVGVRLVCEEEAGDMPWDASPSRMGKLAIAGPLPQHRELTLGDQIYIAKEELPPGLRNRLLRLAAFQNPEFYRAKAMHLSTYGKPRIMACAEELDRHIALPRGWGRDRSVRLRPIRPEPRRALWRHRFGDT